MPSIPQLCQAVLLSLLLLVAQQGASLHALTHHGIAASPTDDEQRAASAERCDWCVAFAQVASALGTEACAPALLGGIAFSLAAAEPVAAHAADAPARRSRGPPPGA